MTDRGGVLLFAGLVAGAIAGAWSFLARCQTCELSDVGVWTIPFGIGLAIASLVVFFTWGVPALAGVTAAKPAHSRAIWRVFEIVAVAFAVYAAFVAKETFDDQRRLSAYQILGMAQASPQAKWYAAGTILEFDGDLVGFDTGCKNRNEPMFFDFVDRPCAIVVGLNISGTLDDRSYGDRLSEFVANDTVFADGFWRNFQFYRGEMTNSYFGAQRMENIRFDQVDLRWSGFMIGYSFSENPKLWSGLGNDGPPASVFVANSDVTGAEFASDDPTRFNFYSTNLSGAEFSGAVLPKGFYAGSNWYVTGNPPLVNDDPSPNLVDFVCGRDIGRGGDPFGHPDCTLTEAGKELLGEAPLVPSEETSEPSQ
jgi:hypothetical protein